MHLPTASALMEPEGDEEQAGPLASAVAEEPLHNIAPDQYSNCVGDKMPTTLFEGRRICCTKEQQLATH